MGAVVFQVIVAGIVGGVCLAFLAYAFGVDRAVVFAIRHPLRTAELLIMIVVSCLPAPRHRYTGRHIGASA